MNILKNIYYTNKEKFITILNNLKKDKNTIIFMSNTNYEKIYVYDKHLKSRFRKLHLIVKKIDHKIKQKHIDKHSEYYRNIIVQEVIAANNIENICTDEEKIKKI